MAFDVAVFRDWVISVAGIVGTVVLLVFLVMGLMLCGKVVSLINKVKRISNAVERAVQSPYYQLASWIGGMFAGIGQSVQSKK